MSTRIAAQARPGPVHITVSDLARSVDYYRDVVGLEMLEHGGGRASVGAGGAELLVLVEEPGARPARGYTGLYHFALLVPERVQLAAWLAHAARDGVPLVGLSDHDVSEAVYLADPDGHGIEIYRDRPRETWEGHVGERLTTMPLDVDSLLGELDDRASAPFDGLPTGTTMGHVHLKVADIPSSVGFYRDVLGFDLTAVAGLSDRINPDTETVSHAQAAFLSAGGYHHHVGANTWESAGAPPAPAGTAALRNATIVLPDTGARDEMIGRIEAGGSRVEDHDGDPLVRDPSGNALVLRVA